MSPRRADFVGTTGGRVSNERPEVLADAGLIARVDRLDPRVDLFDAQRRPYRITIAREQIVAVQSADDLLPGR